MTEILKKFEEHSKLSTIKKIDGMSIQYKTFLHSHLLRYLSDLKDLPNRINLTSYIVGCHLKESSRAVLAQGLGKFFYWGGYMPESDYKILIRSFRLPRPDWSTKDLTEEKVVTFLKYAHSNSNRFLQARNTCIIFLLASIGLRINQLVQLDIEDVKANSTELTIILEKQKETMTSLRRNIDYKIIPLEFSIERFSCDSVYSAYLRQREKIANVSSFFLNQYGGKLTKIYIQKYIESASHYLGFKRYSPHSFRHYVGSKVAKEKGPIEAATLLGHKNLETIMQYINPESDNIL